MRTLLRHGHGMIAALFAAGWIGCGGVDESKPPEQEVPEAGLTCEAPLADCNGDASDGCEADLQSHGDHCDQCSVGCAGGACIAGACTAAPLRIADEQPGPCGMVSDATAVFWAACRGGGIIRLDTATLEKQAVTSNGDWISAIVADTDTIYWAALSESIQRAPKAGGASEVIAVDMHAWSVAVDADTIYWTSYVLGDVGVPADGAVHGVPKAGGAPIELAVGPAAQLCLDETRLFWVDPEGEVIRSILKGGGAPYVVANTQGDVGELFAANGFVYWTDNQGLVRAPAEGGPIEIIDSMSTEAALVGQELWYQRGNELVRRPIAAGTGTPVAWIDGYVSGIAASAGQVYWGNFSNDTIDRLPQ